MHVRPLCTTCLVVEVFFTLSLYVVGDVWLNMMFHNEGKTF